MQTSGHIPVGLAAALALFATGGCERLSIAEPPPPVPAAAQVSIRPATVDLRAGDAVQLAAQASTAERQPIGGADLEYASLTPGLVHVTPTGLVTSLGPAGTAQVRARSGSTEGTAVVNVVAGAPAVIRAVEGSDQTGVVGRALETPIAALVVDAFDNPVRGIPIELFTSSSGGSVSPQRGVTDGDGRVEATWVLGPRAGRQSITVSVAMAERRDLAVPFVATATAAEVATARQAVKLADATAGESVVLRVEARDSFGNAARVDALTWRASSGAVSPGPDDPAGAVWTPGAAGTAAVVAEFPSNGLSVTWSVTVATGPASKLETVFDAPARPRARATLSGAAVRVTDSAGNPVAGHPVAFSVDGAGGGTVAPESAVTDEAGLASLEAWRLGDSGAQQLRAVAAGLEPVLLTIELPVRKRAPRR